MKDKRLTIDSYDNPIVTVIWEDDRDEFSKERKSRVKDYFKRKYNTKNVNIITKSKTNGESDLVVDVSSDITDVNLQYDLIKTILESRNQMDYFPHIIEIDKAVENKMIEKNIEVSHFKKWYIKKIRFTNFLSFGDDEEINYDDYSGLTVVESNPGNTGGKSTLSVDLLLYLFFNTTTKSSKAEDIFNKYSDSNRVFVQGEIQIDGSDYIITRTIKRELNKSGGYNVSSTLDINKVLPNGDLLNETGEQRRETELFIKRSIGTIEDFLMTIMTTASNLEELLESKPTARGAYLSRFLGLEHIKKKEDVAKEVYSAFSKTMISNVHNVENLRRTNVEHEGNIHNLNLDTKAKEKELADVLERIKKGEDYKDDLLKRKYSDIDSELLRIKPEDLELEINKLNAQKKSLEEELSKVLVVKPEVFYDERSHDEIKETILHLKVDENKIRSQIDEVKELMKSVSSGIKCNHCGIELMNAEITKNKISEIPTLENKCDQIKNEISLLSDKEMDFRLAKSKFDEYEKNKLVRDRHLLSIEANDIKIEKLRDKLNRYLGEQDKIKKNNELESQIVKARMRLDELVAASNQLKNGIFSNTSRVESLTNQIESNNVLIKKIETEFEVEKRYKLYLELYGKNGIAKLIMRTMLPHINSELEKLLEDSANFKLEVRINDKNEVDFIMIDNNTGVEKLMSTGSGYEKTISSLALRAVLSRVCSLPKPNIWVADEVFGKVANDSLELIGSFFSKLTTYFDKIFLISFNPIVNNWANHVIKIEKSDNISKIIKN